MNDNKNNQTFYKQIHGFMIFLCITGLFPAKNIFNCDGKQLKIAYINMVYSLIIYLTIIYTYAMYSETDKLTIMQQLLCTVLSLILWIYSCKYLCGFYKEMEIVKEIINNLPGIYYELIKNKSRAFEFYARIILINLYTEINLFVFIEGNKNEKTINKLLLILLNLPRYQMPIMYVFFCEEIISYFNNIKKSFSLCYSNPYYIEKVLSVKCFYNYLK